MFLIGLLGTMGSAPPIQTGGKVGQVAPEFTLPDIKGHPVRLQDFKGKPVVLNFWAFWCDTWKDEMPHLKALAARQDELGFRLVAISVDGKRLQEFLNRTKGEVPFPVLLDAGGGVSARYTISHVPTVVIVDAGGRVRSVKVGYPGNHVILAVLRPLKRHGSVNEPAVERHAP
ncbi:MAG TPA: TlpA disulfide reductase family protein [Chthonomonadaceae bacterium]|nr:TlpA disulfide reductase family protein [Chthonomonadaceae bacterium]